LNWFESGRNRGGREGGFLYRFKVPEFLFQVVQKAVELFGGNISEQAAVEFLPNGFDLVIEVLKFVFATEFRGVAVSGDCVGLSSLDLGVALAAPGNEGWF